MYALYPSIETSFGTSSSVKIFLTASTSSGEHNWQSACTSVGIISKLKYAGGS